MEKEIISKDSPILTRCNLIDALAKKQWEKVFTGDWNSLSERRKERHRQPIRIILEDLDSLKICLVPEIPTEKMIHAGKNHAFPESWIVAAIANSPYKNI